MTGSTITADSQLLASVQEILEGLKKPRWRAAAQFHRARAAQFGATRIEAAFLAFVDKLLVRYLDNPDSDPATRIKIKVIQQRLRPYLAEIPERPVAAVVTASTPACTGSNIATCRSSRTHARPDSEVRQPQRPLSNRQRS